MASAAAGLFLDELRGGTDAPDGVKRVAVLPFENLGSPEDEYFADGIADAIRGKLTSVPGIEVIARGSSKPYKKTNKTPQEIARELGVALSPDRPPSDGRKEGADNRVQVSPELVEVAGTGAPASRWQQPFDAAMTDVFQVQSEIASQVAQALGVVLGAGEEKRLAEKPTQNLAAYDAFLKGERPSTRGPRPIQRAFERRSASTNRRWRSTQTSRRAGAAGLEAQIGPAILTAFRHPESRRALTRRRREGDGIRAQRRGVVPGSRELPADGPRRSFGCIGDVRQGTELEPRNAELLRRAPRWPRRGSAGGMRRSEHLREAQRLAASIRRPSDVGVLGEMSLSVCAAIRSRGRRPRRALTLAPGRLEMVETRAMSFSRAREISAAHGPRLRHRCPKSIDPAELVAYFANYEDLGWVLGGNSGSCSCV